ncbi:hypothetical protein CC78DRAFT_568300 [Lojkania enalia]|uniref:Uncharacterized protein n=1 Tax=Lojkania enalia TaxID=147567 RepID=A0A9P4K9S2_9PLEO|nr:hypothetical protein CC78DRAFT_568300 [Didymosphaeria enalia]
MATGFQATVELTRIFPVEKGVQKVFESALQIVRNFRNSGSDILVEEDLSSAFGRVEIADDLENKFREAIKNKFPTNSKSDVSTYVKPLYRGSAVGLDHQVSETIIRAIPKEQKTYLSTVIQLSFLGWVHNRTYLAAAIEQAMQKRIENGLVDAINPGFDGIFKTLEACSTQTASFPWDQYIQYVVAEIRKSIPSFKYEKRFTAVTANTLFAGIDCFPRLQRFPEEYKMVVKGLQGFITIIIWAWFLLGLTIEIVGTPVGNIRFGPPQVTHVFISWDSGLNVPEIELLDSNKEPVFKTVPADDSSEVDLLSASAERAILKDYCMTKIRREFDLKKAVEDELVKTILALSLIVSKKIQRVREVRSTSRSDSGNRQLNECPVDLEESRIFSSAGVLFPDVKIDKLEIAAMVRRMRGTTFQPNMFPPPLDKYVACFDMRKMRDIERIIQSLVSLTLLFAHVRKIEKCANIPLILTDSRGFVRLTINEMLANEEKVDIEESTLFHQLSFLLIGGHFGREDRDSGSMYFAVSDFGWSIYLDTVGEKDPEEVRPELLHLEEGVWIMNNTFRRKLRIRDANHARHWDPSSVSQMVVIDRGEMYIPRCVTTVLERKDYCCDRDKELLIGLKFVVDESAITQRADSAPRFELYSSFRFMHQTLWTGVKLTKSCSHDEEDTRERRLPMNTVTVGGLGEGFQFEQETPERLCIALVHGDSRSRWLSVLPGGNRQIMLRRRYQTCVDCAVQQAACLDEEASAPLVKH